MRSRNKLAGILAAVALACASGCCDPAQTMVVIPADGQPALLSESVSCPPPVYPEPAPIPGCSGEVQGELVYNLGMGVISNTDSVRLAGGMEKPRGIRLAGGVAARCTNPVPESYYAAVRAGVPAPSPAPRRIPAATGTVAPVAPENAVPWEPGIAASGYCPPLGCAPLPESSEVCPPGANCFTLTDEQALAAPETIVPSAIETPAVTTMPVVPTAESIPEIAIPTESGADKYEVVVPSQGLRPEAGADSLRPAEIPAVPSTPGSLDKTPPLSGVNAPARQASAGEEAAHPEVKLPPSLN